MRRRSIKFCQCSLSSGTKCPTNAGSVCPNSHICKAVNKKLHQHTHKCYGTSVMYWTYIPFCCSEKSPEFSIFLWIGVERFATSMYPNSNISISWVKYVSRKYFLESTQCWRTSFTSRWSTPSKTSCITSGTRAPLHGLKCLRSIREVLWLMPYSFELSAYVSGSSNRVHCCLWSSRVLSCKSFSQNCNLHKHNHYNICTYKIMYYCTHNNSDIMEVGITCTSYLGWYFIWSGHTLLATSVYCGSLLKSTKGIRC